MPSSYRELVQKTLPPAKPAPLTPEEELDSLLGTYQQRLKEVEHEKRPKPDLIVLLREQTINEFIPVFIELVEKYSQTGVSMQMDASDFLQGGSEFRFEFAINGFRTQLLGTVTTEAVAFHETRQNPDVRGEFVSGPLLSLRGLTVEIFRDFICQRLALLVRAATPRR